MKLGALALALAVLALTAGAFLLTARDGSQAGPRGITTIESSLLDKAGDNSAGDKAGDGADDEEAADNERENENEADDQAGDD